MMYGLSFVKHNMVMCVISNKDIKSQPVSDIIGPINDMDVWITFHVDVLITDVVSH